MMKMELYYSGVVVVEVSDYGLTEEAYDRAVAEAKAKFSLPPGAVWTGSQAEPNDVRARAGKP